METCLENTILQILESSSLGHFKKKHMYQPFDIKETKMNKQKTNMKTEQNVKSKDEK